MHDDEPSAVKLLLEWIYGKFVAYGSPKDESMEDLRLHVAAYVVADKYGVETLKEELMDMFSCYVDYKPLPAQKLLQLTQLVYATTIDQKLRNVVAGACATRATDLLSFDEDGVSLQALLEEFEDLWKDLAKAPRRLDTWEFPPSGGNGWSFSAVVQHDDGWGPAT